MVRTALYAFLCCCFLCGQAQTTESNRGRDWLQRYRLGALAALDSSFLSATDKTKLISLEIDRSPTALCAKGSWTDCSMPGTQSTGLQLTGVRLDNQLVKLDWQTTTENNSKGFVLERRSLTDTLRYDSIAYAVGKGTSTVKSKYSYTDHNNLSVATYYRVREVSLDGSYFYSNTVLIWGVAPKLTVLVLPNPGTSNAIGFYISGTSAPSATFTIMNSAGAILVKEQRTGLSGSTFVSMAPYHLKRGFYILTVVTDREHSSQRFIVL